MRFSTLLLLPTAALGAVYGSSSAAQTTSLSTFTTTRTVMRVVTQTSTGTPPNSSVAYTSATPYSGNSTSANPTGAKVSPTTSALQSSGATRGSFDAALLAIVGAVAYFAL